MTTKVLEGLWILPSTIHIFAKTTATHCAFCLAMCSRIRLISTRYLSKSNWGASLLLLYLKNVQEICQEFSQDIYYFVFNYRRGVVF